jgi:energy-coupling factor transport system ATP-binding protein
MAHRVGYLFQNPDDQLFARNVRTEVSFGPKNLGFSDAERSRSVEEALELCGLLDVSEANPYDLHPGKRKMVALASVLAMDVPVLVLDEPTTGQDARNVERMGEIVQESSRRGKTVVAITHDIDFAAEQFERMLVMRQGELILDGLVQEVLSQPDVLETTYVQVSQLARLGQALGLEPPARTEEEFLEIYRAHLKD